MMLRDKIERIRDIFVRPEEELTRLQIRLRRGWRIVVHCYGELARVRAEGMAAELTYRTIFSLIPVVVLGLVMFRVVGGLEEVQTTVENQLYSFFGVPDVPDVYGMRAEPDEPMRDETPLIEPEEPIADFGEESHEVRASIRRALRDATDKVTNLDFASLGIFGLLLFIYAAVALSNAVEYLFNIIFEAPDERPLHLRLAIHWSIITLGSGLLAASLYLSGQFVDYFAGFVTFTTPVRLLHYALSMLASWVLLFLLYALMPNTKVSLRAAAIGSGVGAVLWEIAKLGFQIYVNRAVPYNALYGSLGLIPLFLFWIYLTWIIILFGLVLTHTLQTLRGRNPQRLRGTAEPLPSGDPNWVLPILVAIGQGFMRGTPADQQDLVERLQLPGQVVHEMIHRLEHAGWVARLACGDNCDETYSLVRPPESIALRDVMKVAYELPGGLTGTAWQPLESLRAAQLAVVGDTTLADAIASAEEVG
jgi:membrane protein